jgi:hypothetical protein
MAFLRRPGAEAWVGVAWLEHRLVGPDDAPPRIAVQTLLEDGVPLGDTQLIGAGDPESVEIVAVPGEDLFLVAWSDRALGSFLMLLSPAADPNEDPPDTDPLLRDLLQDLHQTRVALALGHGYAVGLVGGGEGPRPVHLFEVTITERGPELVADDLLGITATDLAIATNGAETWLAWNDGDSVKGVALRKSEGGQWGVPAGQEKPLAQYQGVLRRAQGTEDLALAYAASSAQDVKRLDADDWRPIGSGLTDPERSESLAVTRGESGGRWAIARAFEPGDGRPAEIRIERVRPSELFCESPGECVWVTSDLLESSGPEILWVDGGYLVAWSDCEEIGQTDVFVARARCHSTTTVPPR